MSSSPTFATVNPEKGVYGCFYIALLCSILGVLHFALATNRELNTENDESSAIKLIFVPKDSMNKENSETPINELKEVPKVTKLPEDPVRQQAKSPEQSHVVSESESAEAMGRPKRPEYFYKNIIVHFDLKGAPPRVEYFLELLEFIAKGGATGVLIEWEDMFPWSGELRSVRNTDAYSLEDVKEILGKATILNLEVIPLVQTFGHLEWILKYEKFRRYRENDKYPQVICIGDDKAVDIVKEAIRQVVDIHKPFGVKHFHVGADEAFEVFMEGGMCGASADKIKTLGSGGKLAAQHLAKIAQYTKNLTGGAIILAWHDALNHLSPSEVKDEKLGELIQPVVWDYTEGITTVENSVFMELVHIFGTFWASSAFKGADSPDSMYNAHGHYKRNNIQWVLLQRNLRKISNSVNVQGIIITGWSRHDHMARLCEIWPVSEPSMLLNTQIALIGADPNFETLDREGIAKKAEQNALKIMKCEQDGSFLLHECTFPGKKIYNRFQVQFRELVTNAENEMKENYVKGWLSPYNIQHRISQNWYLNQLYFRLGDFAARFNSTSAKLMKEMKKFFFDNTVDEFFFINVDPYVQKMEYYISIIEKLRKIRSYGGRAFKILRRFNSHNRNMIENMIEYE